MRLDKNGWKFTVFLGLLSALPPLAIDMGLPALPDISSGLHTSAAMAGMTLSLFLFGFALAPIVLGPVSDHFGRRRVLLGGLVVFTVSGLACALSPSIEWLLTARLVQGMGAGAGAVLPIAIVRDVFERASARTRLSYVTLVLSVAPVIAPSIGAHLTPVLGWRGIYGFLCLTGCALFFIVLTLFEETLPAGRRNSAAPAQILRRYCTVLTQPMTVGYMLLNGLSFCCMFAFISGSPMVFIESYGMDQRSFALLFACAACGTIGGSILNGKLIRLGWSSRRLLHIGAGIGIFATLALCVQALTGHASIFTLIPFLIISNSSYGFIGPNAAHEAMQPMPHMAGAVAAVLRCIQMLFGALGSAVVAAFFDGHTPISMAGTMFAASLCLAAILFAMGRHREKTAQQSDTLNPEA